MRVQFKTTRLQGIWFVNVKKPYLACMDDFGNLVMVTGAISNVVSDN